MISHVALTAEHQILCYKSVWVSLDENKSARYNDGWPWPTRVWFVRDNFKNDISKHITK